MFRNLRFFIAKLISPEREHQLFELETAAKKEMKTAADMFLSIDEVANRRVAEITAQADPLEPLLRNFNGVFSDNRVQPEDGLSEADRIQMEMFGYRNHKDPHFHYLMDWIVNTNTSAMLKAPMSTEKQIVLGHMYARSLIAVSQLLKEKIGRLSSLHERRAQRAGAFDSHTTVE